MYICIYIHLFLHMYICMYLYVYIYIDIDLYIHLCIHVFYVCIHIQIYIITCICIICIYIFIYTHIYFYIYIYIYIYVLLYVFINTPLLNLLSSSRCVLSTTSFPTHICAQAQKSKLLREWYPKLMSKMCVLCIFESFLTHGHVMSTRNASCCAMRARAT